MKINLNNYDLIIVNSSGGKDSSCALFEVCQIADLQSFPKDKIIISHQCLGDMEWKGTKELVLQQAEFFGIKNVHISKRRNSIAYEENLLEYIERRGKFPSNKQRFCTSDFKRAPGQRVVTSCCKNLGDCKVLYVFGFRSEESPSRAKKEPFVLNESLSTQKRKLFDWLPIHDWTTKQVWDTIKQHNIPYHFAYDLGIPRLSCVFCIFSPKDALVLAGKHNPELLDRYVEVEKKIGHSFKSNLSLSTIKDLIESGYEPTKIENWTM